MRGSRVLSGALDLLFPARCPFCGRTGGSRTGPCRGCEDADFWIPPAERVFPGEHYVRCVCAGWYRDELRQAVRQFKFGGRREYAEAYGRMLAGQVRLFLPGAYDAVTWMPVSGERLKERGYDQSRLIAQVLAGETGKPLLPLLEKGRDNPPQSSLRGWRARRANVAGVYTVSDRAAAAGRRLLLVDDILTTGATMEEGARTLRAAGAAQVVAAALCRTPRKDLGSWPDGA